MEIGGLGAGAGAGDQQVAPVGEVQRHQVGVVAAGELRHPLVGRSRGGGRDGKLQVDAVEQRGVVGHMAGAQVGVGEGDGGRERAGRADGGGLGIVVHAAPVAVVGGDREQQGDGGGAGDPQFPARGAHLAVLGHRPDQATEAQGAGDALGVVAPAVQRDARRIGGGGGGTQRSVEGGGEGERARGVHGQPDHDDVVRRGGEHLAAVAHPVARVLHRGDGGGEVEVAPVVEDLRGLCAAAVEGQPQVADGLVLELLDGDAHQIAVDQGPGLVPPALEDQPAGLGERGGGAGVVVVVGAAGPQRVLVELEPFDVRAAEDHGAQPAVAHRQGPEPLVGGAGVPQAEAGVSAGAFGVVRAHLRLQEEGAGRVAYVGKRLPYTCGTTSVFGRVVPGASRGEVNRGRWALR